MKLWTLIPELIVGGLCLALVPIAGWVKGRWRYSIGIAAIIGLLVAIAFTARMLSWSPQMVMEIYAVDGLANVFKLLIELGAVITLLLLLSYFRGHTQLAHAPLAVLFVALGGLGLSSSMDLTLIILFLQMISFSSYVLAALVRSDGRALEASLKYFIFGAVCLAIMAYGLTFLYGMTGSLDLRVIGNALEGRDRMWIALTLGLILVGYGFEITMVPFHAWAPDVFAGATAPVSGFVAVVPKIAAFAGLVRLFLYALPNGLIGWPWMIAGLAAITMTFGNLAALRQQGLKRLLAYSSIAQAGYILMALAVLQRSPMATAAATYYLAAYLFMNLGAFAVVAQVERSVGTDQIEEIGGMGRSAPMVAAVFALSLLSLAGIPPLAGFAGKVYLLQATIDGNMLWLAIIGAINMVIGLFYYIRVIGEMYWRPAKHPFPLITGVGFTGAYAVLLFGTLALGIWPAPAMAVTGNVSQLVK
jgi:NADH-quinone oxidoreductase subunit N